VRQCGTTEVDALTRTNSELCFPRALPDMKLEAGSWKKDSVLLSKQMACRYGQPLTSEAGMRLLPRKPRLIDQ
jgi:hypothetical protein